MFLFFDTETTGLPKSWQAPVNNLNNWPRLVQLAWLFIDEFGNEMEIKNIIIKPEGFDIPKDASSVHGITTEMAEKEGIDLSKALLKFAEVIEGSKILVAHNMSFDKSVMGAEFLRKDIKNSLSGRLKICTMHGSVDFCKIKNEFGYKWPKLIELHKKLFNRGFDGAHDAFADVKACARCFFELKKRGIIKL